jgi:hypothetical protein
MKTRRTSAALSPTLPIWQRGALLGIGMSLWVASGCHRKVAPDDDPVSESAPAPDRLEATEKLPEAETAFGLPIPKGMRLVRHFNDAAYFAGELDMKHALEHIRKYVIASDVQMLAKGALFSRAYIVGDESKRLVRILVTPIQNGTQIRIQDITPPRAVTGLSQAEVLRQAGRNPDGTVMDQNQLY